MSEFSSCSYSGGSYAGSRLKMLFVGVAVEMYSIADYVVSFAGVRVSPTFGVCVCRGVKPSNVALTTCTRTT